MLNYLYFVPRRGSAAERAWDAGAPLGCGRARAPSRQGARRGATGALLLHAPLPPFLAPKAVGRFFKRRTKHRSGPFHLVAGDTGAAAAPTHLAGRRGVARARGPPAAGGSAAGASHALPSLPAWGKLIRHRNQAVFIYKSVLLPILRWRGCLLDLEPEIGFCFTQFFALEFFRLESQPGLDNQRPPPTAQSHTSS